MNPIASVAKSESVCGAESISLIDAELALMR